MFTVKISNCSKRVTQLSGSRLSEDGKDYWCNWQMGRWCKTAHHCSFEMPEQWGEMHHFSNISQILISRIRQLPEWESRKLKSEWFCVLLLPTISAITKRNNILRFSTQKTLKAIGLQWVTSSSVICLWGNHCPASNHLPSRLLMSEMTWVTFILVFFH